MVVLAFHLFFDKLSVESCLESEIKLAVDKNPYREWESLRTSSDYRSRETQASSLTRQMLRRPEYLRDSNRVNPGPYRSLRARAADSKPQEPHITCNEDVWGWQRWTEVDEYVTQSELSSNLFEKSTSKDGIPGCGSVES